MVICDSFLCIGLQYYCSREKFTQEIARLKDEHQEELDVKDKKAVLEQKKLKELTQEKEQQAALEKERLEQIAEEERDEFAQEIVQLKDHYLQEMELKDKSHVPPADPCALVLRQSVNSFSLQ